MAKRSSKDFKVAVIGGGMCGLLCAIGLTKAGIEVDVFEAAPKFEEIGAGVGLGDWRQPEGEELFSLSSTGPNAIRALEGLGVLDAVLSRSDQPIPTKRSFLFVSGYEKHKHIYDYPALPEDIGLGIYRPAFLEALMPILDPRVTHFNKRCVSISRGTYRGHIIHFADGTTHETDLVIGADGIKSVTRDVVVNSNDNHLVFSNTVAYRGLVSAEALESAGVKTDLRKRPVCFVGNDRHIITFPIQGKRTINVVAFSTNSSVPVGSVVIPAPWVESVSEQELLDDYAGWGNDAMIILQQIKRPSKWSLHYLDPPLDNFVRDKVVLIGDAAHAMLPHLGSGVGQGFEDVFVLCALLGHPQTNATNLEAALLAYDSVRVKRANMVLERSTFAGQAYEGYHKDQGSFQTTLRQLTGIWEPVWHHDLVEEVEHIMNMLYTPKARL